MSFLNAHALSHRPWNEIKKFNVKVHNQVREQATHTYFNLPVERYGVRNDSIQDYIKTPIEGCSRWKSPAPPDPNRKVSISSLS